MRWACPGVVAFVLACGPSEPRYVGWPALDPDTLSFVVETREGTRTVHGPFPPAGPETRLQIEEDGLVYLIALPIEWLRSLHPRIATDRLEETRLVAPPETCSTCAGPCRGLSDASIFHPIGEVGQRFRLDESGFVGVTDAPFADLDVELPARWACEERIPSAPFDRLVTWPRGTRAGSLQQLPDGRLVVLGEGLRFVGGGTDEVWSVPSRPLYFRRIASFQGRLFMTAGPPEDGEADGSILEIEIDEDEVRLVRLTDVAFSPAEIEVDEHGLVIAGRRGQVGTSTDGVQFKAELLPHGLGLTALLRVDDPDRPYLFGGSRGSLVRGDPWAEPRNWTFEYAAMTDSSVSNIKMLEADAEHPRLTLAKTVERGVYVQEPGRAWEKLAIEVPGTHPVCTQTQDGCGFTRIGEKTLGFEADGRRVLVTARNCPVLFVMRVDDGCASSVELRTEEGLVEEARAIALTPEGALLVVEDGVLRVPIDGL